MDIERTVDIAAPVEKVWAAMTDVQRWSEWTPTVTSVDLLDGGPVRVGSPVRIRQPRLPAAVWTESLKRRCEAGR